MCVGRVGVGGGIETRPLAQTGMVLLRRLHTKIDELCSASIQYFSTHLA